MAVGRAPVADDTSACYERLARTLCALVPGIDVMSRWSGQVIETADGLPYIGEMAERQFAATGFSGNGMTFGTRGGMMACDWVLGRRNPWRHDGAVGDLHAHGLPRRLERGGADVGLPMPRLTIQDQRLGARRPGGVAACRRRHRESVVAVSSTSVSSSPLDTMTGP